MRRWIMVLAVMIFGAMSLPAFAGELDDLKAMVLQLQKRIEQLENQQKMQAAKPPQKAEAAKQPQAEEAAKPVMAGSMPGSFVIPGTDTSLKIYGNARVDATYDFATRSNNIKENDWSSAVFAQPLDTNSANLERKGQFYATARASRLGIVTSTPSKWGDLEVKLEADFNAPNDYMGELASNGTQFRLRHAYGQWGNLLVGQTWSNFMDLRSYPETVDFNPTGNVALIRQTQLRYTLPLGGSSLAFSVENPESLSSIGAPAADFDRVPDFVVNWSLHGQNAHVSARAATMEYNNDLHSKRGYAVGLSGSSRLGAGTLVASIQGGDGIGRYMFNSILQGATETGTDLRLWKALGWHVGYTLPWSSAFRSNFIVSQTYFGTDDISNTSMRSRWSGTSASVGWVDELVPNKRIDQASVNLIWGITKNVEAGIEYSWGRRFTFADEEGTQHRINTMIQYNFF